MFSLSADFKKNYKNYLESVKHLPIPYLKLKVTVPADAIYQEWLQVKHLVVPHRSHDYESHRGWESLCLHGLSATQTEWYTQYGYQRGFPPAHDWTEIADQCPQTVAWIKQTFPSNHYMRIRFMMLRAGGFIAPHTDTAKCELAPINISITQPAGCDFTWTEFGVQPWQPAEAYLMNISFEHAVTNSSDTDRLHMIIDDFSDFPYTCEQLIKDTVDAM